MEKLLEILNELNADIDFAHCDTLIDDGLLDSFAILELIAELNDAFDIEITAKDFVEENFNSLDTLVTMVKRLQEE